MDQPLPSTWHESFLAQDDVGSLRWRQPFITGGEDNFALWFGVRAVAPAELERAVAAWSG